MSVRALLGLGSNLGDRIGQIRQAVALLDAQPGIWVLKISRLYQTQPVGMAELDANWFINAAVLLETDLSAQDLLQLCLNIEQQLGRQRRPLSSGKTLEGYASRTMDIDVLFYGSAIIHGPGLDIPHPRLHERAFILVPLTDIAPDWRHPVLEKTLAELAQAQPDSHTVQPISLAAL